MTRRDAAQKAVDRLRAISLGGSIGVFDVAVRKVIEEAMAERERPLIEAVQRLHFDAAECLPECDSIAHAELCPVTNPGALILQQAREIERLNKNLQAAKAQNDIISADWLKSMRNSCHVTYNGGHHYDGCLDAFHHGMDTVFNVLDDAIARTER